MLQRSRHLPNRFVQRAPCCAGCSDVSQADALSRVLGTSHPPPAIHIYFEVNIGQWLLVAVLSGSGFLLIKAP